METEHERYMYKLIKEKNEEIEKLRDHIGTLNLKIFDLNAALLAKDERREIMIRKIEQENLELSLMLNEQRELTQGGYWLDHPKKQEPPEAQNLEIPFEKDLYICGESETDLPQTSERVLRKRKDHTNEASTSRGKLPA